jgi:hypothetical protein|nr:MAG TPA: hypothetical protein [Crassvirales sp.]
MTNEKIILQLEKGYDIKNPQLAQVLTNIENNGVTKEEFTEAMGTKADLVGSKVPAEQLPSYVDDVIEFDSITTGSASVEMILNEPSFTNKIWYIEHAILGTTIDYTKKFVDFGANTSEEDWTIINPEEGKIYVKIGEGVTQNHSYRWTGTTLVDLDKTWSDKITFLESKTLSVNLGTITDPLDLSVFTNTSKANVLYTYLNQRHKFQLINLLWVYNNVQYDSPIIDVDPVERSFRIYNQGCLQTYKVLKEDDNYSLVKVKEFPDFVYLDYSTLGTTLDDETIEQIKKASIILVNDNANYPNSKFIYVVKSKTNTYLQFVMVGAIDGSDQKIIYKELSVNTSTKKWVINTKNYTLPYGAYSQFGFTGKNADAVNQEVARLVNMNSCYITPSDLNKVHSGDKLENIKNATFLILDEGDGKTKIFIRGYESTAIIYYNCINNSGSVKYILLRLESNILSSIENAYFDDIMFTNYRIKGGTRTNKDSMYKELVAQLTENTYVIDSSKLNTVLTDAEASSVQNATTLIVTNVVTENNILVFNRGALKGNSLNFFNMESCIDGSITMNRIIFDVNVKKCSNIRVAYADPATYYIGKGGKNSTVGFNKSFLTLYNNLYVIDSSLLNTTITDTNIRESISKANILIIEDSTNNSYKVCIRGFVSTNSIYFFNLQNANADNITATRVQFNTTTNLLNSQDVYLQSAFNAYKLGGGTKYTTESAFNTALATAIDAYTPTI